MQARDGRSFGVAQDRLSGGVGVKWNGETLEYWVPKGIIPLLHHSITPVPKF